MAAAAGGGVGQHNVFVYGSLMADEVVSVLLARVPPSSHALLPNHHRFSIKGRVYPAILPVESKDVHGKVVRGITDAELEIIDNFEDVEYVRKTVQISLLDTAEKLFAEAYIWGNQDDPDLYGEWDFEEWKKVRMKDFIEMTRAFMDYSVEPEAKSTRVETYQSFYKQDSPSDI
ncbi:hypothetical protein LUZ60_001655 [Juncus effusus]|nr:hypothetical protein LUZ60_001655 [Juncus effusus]